MIDILARYLANMAALTASETTPATTAGITSGQGNQGTSNVAMTQGQAGTSGQAGSVPREL